MKLTFKAEPARLVSFAGAIISVAVIHGVLDLEQAAAWEKVVLTGVSLLWLGGGEVIRSQAFSKETIEQAGLIPAQVVADAKANQPTNPSRL